MSIDDIKLNKKPWTRKIKIIKRNSVPKNRNFLSLKSVFQLRKKYFGIYD